MSILNELDYYNKVYGGWLGKNIGGTLGGPHEGARERLGLTFFSQRIDGPMANDDLDLQLVALHAVEQYGCTLSAENLAQEWVEHVFFPFDEYGYSLANLRRGLIPPVAGWFNNPFTDCMGAPIRSELWAMMAPGAPSLAVHYAIQDATIDHAGGEGLYGEVFFAAIESAAFFESNREELIELGLSFLPEDCRTARAIRDLVRWHSEGVEWVQARKLLIDHHGSPNFTDAPQNVAFTILGWLYGRDFGDAILKAVNCGLDTDCTGATLGAILGIILGADGIPHEWAKAVGDKIVVSPAIKGFRAPSDLNELSMRTMRAGHAILAHWNPPLRIEANNPSALANDMTSFWKANPVKQDTTGVTKLFLPRYARENPGLELQVDCGLRGPAIGVGENKEISLILYNRSTETWNGRIQLGGPQGMTFEPQEAEFTLESHDNFQLDVMVRTTTLLDRYSVDVCIERLHAGCLWNRESLQFGLVGACQWMVSGPNQNTHKPVICPGNKIDFGAALGELTPGLYTATTTIYNPEERNVRLIVATSSSVTAVLNDDVIIDHDSVTDFMPAFHRAVPTKFAELRLQEGYHQLRVEVKKGLGPLNVYVLPVASVDKRFNGQYFYLTDFLFVGQLSFPTSSVSQKEDNVNQVPTLGNGNSH